MTGTLPEWVTDPQAATPPLDEYLAAEKEDGNIFWRIGCGHHENLLDAAVEQRDEARAEVDRLKAQVQHWMGYATGQNEEANTLAAEVATLRAALEMAAQSYIQLEGELREVTSIAGLNCESCGADISEYAKGITLCAICDSEVDDK